MTRQDKIRQAVEKLFIAHDVEGVYYSMESELPELKSLSPERLLEVVTRACKLVKGNPCFKKTYKGSDELVSVFLSIWHWLKENDRIKAQLGGYYSTFPSLHFPSMTALLDIRLSGQATSFVKVVRKAFGIGKGVA